MLPTIGSLRPFCLAPTPPARPTRTPISISGAITTDAAFADVIADRRALVSQLGEPLFLDHFGREWNVFFILSDGTEGEIFFGHEGALDAIDVGPFDPLLDEARDLARRDVPVLAS